MLKKLKISLTFGIILFTMVQCTNEAPKSSPFLVPFTKNATVNPCLLPAAERSFICPVRNTEVFWEEKDVFNPASVVKNDTLFLLYRAEDVLGKYNGTSRIGLAYSLDGYHFENSMSRFYTRIMTSLKDTNGKEDAKIRGLWKTKVVLII